MKQKIQSQAMTFAHQIKEQFPTFADALRAGWVLAKLQREQQVQITFAKQTGEIREAKAVGMGSVDTLVKGYVRFVELLENAETQWRSFRLERLVF